ncbi:MAG: DUF3341 domain-containing protein [Candidatus Wallbacteria bacterium]|nr:DUF3341 domain-containing protein [Candidatus Wallbacteria bacterium]
MKQSPLFALLAEFERVEELRSAAERVRDEGYTQFEAYAPFPVAGLAEAIGFHTVLLPMAVLGGGIFGCVAGFLLQYYVAVIAYPINIGGRPLNSWPAFIPITFETTVLCASLTAVLGMLAFNGLPRPHHPLFAVPAFRRATRDRFFIAVASSDPKFESESTRRFLQGLNPSEVHDVPR